MESKFKLAHKVLFGKVVSLTVIVHVVSLDQEVLRLFEVVVDRKLFDEVGRRRIPDDLCLTYEALHVVVHRIQCHKRI